MTDREKIIKGIEIHTKPNSRCVGCPYLKTGMCADQLYMDALTVLKEQEPKIGKWILDDDDANSWKCSECGGLQQIIDGTPYENGWYFCPHCGTKLEEQAVKWE